MAVVEAEHISTPVRSSRKRDREPHPGSPSFPLIAYEWLGVYGSENIRYRSQLFRVLTDLSESGDHAKWLIPVILNIVAHYVVDVPKKILVDAIDVAHTSDDPGQPTSADFARWLVRFHAPLYSATEQERDMSWAVSIAYVSRFTRYDGIATSQIDGHPVLIDNIYHRVSSDGRSLCLEIGVIPRDVVTFEALVEPHEHRATIRPFRRLQNWTRAHSVPMQFSSASRLEIDSLWKPPEDSPASDEDDTYTFGPRTGYFDVWNHNLEEYVGCTHISGFVDIPVDPKEIAVTCPILSARHRRMRSLEHPDHLVVWMGLRLDQTPADSSWVMTKRTRISSPVSWPPPPLPSPPW